MMYRLILETGGPWYKRAAVALAAESLSAFVAILCLLSGIPILIHPGSLAPNSVLNLLPSLGVILWGLMMTIGGSALLLGIAFTEYHLQRTGSAVLAGVTTVFTLALVFYLPNSLVTLGVFFFFTVAMGARYWALGRLIKLQERVYDDFKDLKDLERALHS